MSNILDVILQSTYTLLDVKHRLRVLKSHLERKIFGNKPVELSIQDANWLKTLPVDFEAQFNKDNLSDEFGKVEKQINSITPLVIYLSFEADEVVKSQINTWLHQNLTQKMIFEIKFDPNLIGGSALVKNGIYQDFSLKSKMEQQKETILTEFKKYIA